MKDDSLAEITSHADIIAFSRAMLAHAGLTRKSLDGTVYWTGGEGEQTLALIHGVNDHAGTWSLVAPVLMKTCRLIIPDLPGHGESEPKTGALDMQHLVDRLAAVLDAEGVTRVTLVGNSMGAWISILYTLAHPDRVAELFLESGGGLAIPLGVPLVAANREEAVPILQAVHGPNAQFPDWAVDALITRSSDSPMLRLIAGGMMSYFIDDRLAAIRVPTTVVWGANDGVVTRAYIEQLHAGIAGARLCIIDDAAHIPHAQQPERFIACLQATS
ncbi:MAG TPA: alpha/beta hydrolase [Thermoanaerobaculia bacterium]|jgi:pimeloyl-ACP methyl ester carboxylesterase|nr:alpha/beta hydrolase [Thermoanaerobaculia bacterium]